ncbi:MAG: hypothetical protein H6Q44_785 [Deltaproteobacteria bacterium]|nr:hypothetical protein [Deltaproteobacteria bacterium]
MISDFGLQISDLRSFKLCTNLSLKVVLRYPTNIKMSVVSKAQKG